MEQPLSQQQKNKEYIKLLSISAILFLILSSFILYLSWPLITGKSVVLATQPVDPFDPLRGQFIVIRYEINIIPTISNAVEGSTVYVALEEDKYGIWRYDSASLNKPKDSLFIAGNVKSIYGNQTSVEYGIEQYFFERNAEFSTRNMTVKAKLSSSGGARIVELLQNGKPVKITYQNRTLTS